MGERAGVTPRAMFADDIIATGTPENPVRVECAKQGRVPRPLAHGWLVAEPPQSGLQAYAADYTVLESYGVRTVGEAGFSIEVNLGAPQAGHAGRLDWELDTGMVVAVGMRDPVKMLTRRREATKQVRCGLWIDDRDFASYAPLRHLENNTTIKALLQSHLDAKIAPSSPSVLAAARGLMMAMTETGTLGDLRRQVAGLSLITESLSLLCPDQVAEPAPPSRRDVKWIVEVRDALDALGSQDRVVISELARMAGVSERSLCRNFRAVFGISIVAYVAQSRMERARLALEREGATIDYAAFLAGFAHTTNFHTAFRRRYGYPPSRFAGPPLRRPGRLE